MKPRPVYANAHEMAMESARRLRLEDRANLQLIITRAFCDFSAGRDCAEHWRTMADALNTAEMLAQAGIASDDASKAWDRRRHACAGRRARAPRGAQELDAARAGTAGAERWAVGGAHSA